MLGTSLAVQWLGFNASIAESVYSNPQQETKIPQAVWCGKKTFFFVKNVCFHLLVFSFLFWFLLFSLIYVHFSFTFLLFFLFVFFCFLQIVPFQLTFFKFSSFVFSTDILFSPKVSYYSFPTPLLSLYFLINSVLLVPFKFLTQDSGIGFLCLSLLILLKFFGKIYSL